MRNKEMLVQVLYTSFCPQFLRVVDESAHHHGHRGVQGSEGLTHARVEIVSGIFQGQTAIQRQRTVMTALRPMLDAGLHALSIWAYTPSEWTHVDQTNV